MRKLRDQRAVALLMVLATLLVVVILANVILTIISSQSRLTHHQVSRIQAYYAGLAGMNYALEMLRIGPAAGGWTWVPNMCPPPNGCNLPIDPQFPNIIRQPVKIVLRPASSAGCSSPPAPAGGVCVETTVDYAYTP